MKVVLSGGSGVGKTETLAELLRRGYTVVGEAARVLLAEPQYANYPHGGEAQRIKFQSDLLQLQSYKERNITDKNGLVFFDRSVIDVLVFCEYLGVCDKLPLTKPPKDYDLVFILNPLETYLAKDGKGRWETETERDHLHQRCIDLYKQCGYEPIVLDAASINERADKILKTIDDYTQDNVHTLLRRHD